MRELTPFILAGFARNELPVGNSCAYLTEYVALNFFGAQFYIPFSVFIILS